MASKVICIDPWFNNAVEQQAFCRVHRMGQTKETRLTRLVVENTVDERLMKMQKSKQKDIDLVMKREGKRRM
jgi:SNF2 family DNA or RNA helicase